MVDPISIPHAAQLLELSPNRVRVMAAHGQLLALKIGDRWLVERSAVESRRRRGGVSGRPFAPHNAWALLFLASGWDVEGIDPSVRSRLRRALAIDGLGNLAPRLVLRAESRLLNVHPGELRYLIEDPDFVRAGVSAAGEYGLDLLPGHEADGYVSASALAKLARDHALADAGPGNVRVRVVPDQAWRVLAGISIAPIAAVALDLAEDPDPRSAAAGQAALHDIDCDLLDPGRIERYARA